MQGAVPCSGLLYLKMGELKMLKAIHCQPLLTKQQVPQRKEQPQPKYYCATCLKLKNDNLCDCFQRRVEPDYNRCFNHSNYKPVLTVFKAADNIEEIAPANERKKYA